MRIAHTGRMLGVLVATLLGGSLLTGCEQQHTLPAAQPAASAEAQRLAANKQMAVDFYELAVNQKNVREAARRYVGSTYIQHNPGAADGAEAMIKFLEARYTATPQRTIKVVRTIAEGDLVVAHSLAKNTPTDRGTVFVDIWRVKDGKFVEHWDLNEAVPPGSANPRGII